MITKKDLIKKLEEMPDDIQVFYICGEYDDVCVRIFTEPKDKEFIKWYFGP